MAKKTFKVKCESVNQRTNGGNVIFSIGGDTIPPTEPGKPATRTAKTGFNIVFTNPQEVIGYQAGKDYTITIDG